MLFLTRLNPQFEVNYAKEMIWSLIGLNDGFAQVLESIGTQLNEIGRLFQFWGLI